MVVNEYKRKTDTQRIKENMLYVIPSKQETLSTIYLSESKLSWITIEWLSEELLNYSTKNYEKLFSLHPLQRGKIVMFDNEEC